MNAYVLAGFVFLALAVVSAVASYEPWWLPLVWAAIGVICFVQNKRT